MKDRSRTPDRTACVYEAPAGFVFVFYGLLIAWSVVSIYLIGSKALIAGWPAGQLAMVGFVIAYTWYWCLGIFYRVVVNEKGDIQLKSFRRVLNLEPSDVIAVESPKLSLIPTVFVRFRLSRERAYLFGLTSSLDLSRVFKVMHRNNRALLFKGLAGML